MCSSVLTSTLSSSCCQPGTAPHSLSTVLLLSTASSQPTAAHLSQSPSTTRSLSRLKSTLPPILCRSIQCSEGHGEE